MTVNYTCTSSDGESPDRLIVDSNLFIGFDPDQSNLIEGYFYFSPYHFIS